ncbi:hypothetical protein RF11_06935 [Thelohanellus kitauei]|uniref:Uncharacterized protein n=1 Tax=Thelohanellus kitauei TaxID=669202 RepID=A0A0C2N3P2_THEKT|nr:hypothetical protein RF11_06935 [Thelohanellus kitauei]
MIWLVLITFGISLSSALIRDCTLTSWKELDMTLDFYLRDPTIKGDICTADGELKSIPQKHFSDLRDTLRDNLLCVYRDFAFFLEDLWPQTGLKDDEKKLIDDFIIEQALDTTKGKECGVKTGFDFTTAITPKVVIEELFSGKNRRHYFLPIYCYLKVAKKNLEELETEIGAPAKLAKAKTLIDLVVYTGTGQEKTVTKKTTSQIQTELCEGFRASDASSNNVRGWADKKYLWASVRCRANLVTELKCDDLKPGNSAVKHPLPDSDTEQAVAGHCSATNYTCPEDAVPEDEVDTSYDVCPSGT